MSKWIQQKSISTEWNYTGFISSWISQNYIHVSCLCDRLVLHYSLQDCYALFCTNLCVLKSNVNYCLTYSNLKCIHVICTRSTKSVNNDNFSNRKRCTQVYSPPRIVLRISMDTGTLAEISTPISIYCKRCSFPLKYRRLSSRLVESQI